MSEELARMEGIFSEALTKGTPTLRAAYLDEACGENAELRQRVEALLATYDAASGGFLDLPQIDKSATAPAPLSERPGTKIGRYKLLQQIGEGGFGVVFMAEQEHPVRRRVALKIIKLGMDTRQVVARFEAERQALAMMEHPNIAKVLDGGATETGRPYFVMELVKGVPITQYCDEHHLTPRERLALFLSVCHAVQHAHQKGIIHRDLKPSNVMVAEYDEKPVAKVIDFGVAKAVGQQLTEKTMFTAFGQVIGTMEYMSPEHAKLNQLDIDTRSDVYSLGVILYELLTGQTPFDRKRLQSAAFDEMLRIIREDEPLCPSTQLSRGQTLPSVAANRHTEPTKLTRLIRGELDWIVMKSLEKDRNRRYETASVFAADVQRYLNDEPVMACPPSTRYKLRKFASRHRAAIAIAAAFAGILVLGAVMSTWQAVRASRAEVDAKANERHAIQERDDKEQARREAVASAAAERVAKQAEAEQRIRAEEVSNYLVSALSSPAPNRDGRTITIAEVLDRDAKELQDKFAGNPRTKAALLEAIAQSYGGLGLFRDEIPLLEALRTLRSGTLGPDHPDTLQTMQQLAWAYNRAGRYDDAVPLSEATVKLMKAKLGQDHPETMYALQILSLNYWSANRLKDAVPLMQEALKLGKVKLGPDHPATLVIMSDLGAMYLASGRTEEALLLAEQTVKLLTSKVGSERQETIWSRNGLAEIYRRTGRVQEAVAIGEGNVKLATANLGADHPETLELMHSLAISYQIAGRLHDSISLLEETLKVARVKLGPAHPNIIWWSNDLASALRSAGRSPEAVSLMDDLLKVMKAKLGPDHPETIKVMNSLASFQTEQGRQSQWERATAALASARAAVEQQKWDEAVAYCMQQLDSLPHEPAWNSARKALCRELAAWDEVFNRLVKLRHDDVDLWVGRGRHFAILHDWKQALAQYEKVQSNLPPNSERLEYACLLLLSNDNARYEQYVNQIKSDDVAVRTMVTAIAPQAIVSADQVIQWSKQDTRYAGQPRPPAAFIQALAYYRAGQFEDALKSAQALSNHNWPATAWSQNWLVRAMAAHRIGDPAEARRCMTEARKLLAAAPPVEKYDPTIFPVGDMLGAEVLLREADALLEQPASRPAPATLP